MSFHGRVSGTKVKRALGVQAALQTLGQCGKLFFQGAHVRALIGHFGKFHGFVLSLFYSFVRDLGTLYHSAKNKTSPKKAGLP